MQPQVRITRITRKSGRHAKHSEDRMPVRQMSTHAIVKEAEAIVASNVHGLWQHSRPADGEFVCWVYDVRKHGVHVANLLHP